MLTVGCLSGTAASAEETAAQDESWQQEVLGTGEADIVPEAVVETRGSVDNAEALVPGGSGVATLSWDGTGAAPVIVLDHGPVVVGLPYFTVASTSGEVNIRTGYSESRKYILNAAGQVTGDHAGYLGTGVGSGRTRTTQVSEAGTYTTPANALQGGIRFHAITLTSPGTVTISRVGVVSKYPNYAADDYAGWFLSDDEELNDIWYTGAYTVDSNMAPIGAQNDSKVPVILDGSKRDRRIWAGDLFNAGRSTYAAFGYGATGSDYISHSIDVLGSRQAANGSVPGESRDWTADPAVAQFYSTAYSIYFPVGVVDYYRHSGDVDFAIAQYARLKAQLEYNLGMTDDDGLIVTNTSGQGRDWDFYDGGKAGTVTATNVLYYHALTESAWLAAHMIENDPGNADAAAWAADQKTWEQRAAQVRESINATLFDSDRGVYKLSDRDWGDKSGNAVPQDANSMAVLWGVAPEDKVEGILDWMRENLWEEHGPQPYSADAHMSTLISTHVSGFELAARYEAGDTDGALDLTKLLWGDMADSDYEFYSGAFFENQQQNGDLTDANKSLAHAWATGPTWAMSSYLLGVQPVEPGFESWQIKPHLGDLQWSKGQVPTPHGDVDVSWSRDEDGLTLDVTAPEGTSGEVWVPREDGGSTFASTGATFLRAEDGFDVYAAGSGSASFVAVTTGFGAIEDVVADYLASGQLSNQLAQNLTRFLERAEGDYQDGRAQAADSALRSFLNQIGNANSKRASADAQSTLVGLAEQLQAVLREAAGIPADR